MVTALKRTRSGPWSITNGHHPKNWKETGIHTVQGTVQAARTSATSVCVLAKPAVPSEVTAVSDHILPPLLWLVCVGLFLLFFFSEKVLFKTKASTVCDVSVRTCMWRSSRSRF